MDNKIRVRFAPSNTGHLHIGGARTALFNWFFAKHHGGTTILRIEDTDKQRSTEEFYEAIIEAFDWLELDWDEGPFRQSDREKLYNETIDTLISKNLAYRCTCTPEEVQKMRDEATKQGKTPMYDGTCREKYQEDPDIPFCIRLKTPDEGKTSFHDLLAGEVTFQNNQIDDMIIRRTDGSPTYNLCVAIDDIDMQISHVIRGNDHLSNTPKQILVYQALNSPIPEFVHISMILGSDKKRLSKRHGATSVLEYKNQGYLPEALINYLVRLGWSHGDQEIFDKEEIIKLFSIENLNQSSAVFNPEKMDWVSQEHMKKRDIQSLLDLFDNKLKDIGYDPDTQTAERRKGIIEEMRTRGTTIEEIVNSSLYFFSEEITMDEKATKKFLTKEISPVLEKLCSAIDKIDQYTIENIKTVFNEILSSEDLKIGKLAHPIRVAVTGGTVSPGIFETLYLLDKELVIKRINNALNIIHKND